VNPVHDNPQVEEQSSTASQLQIAEPLGPRVEHCEFELLLQRAMQILNARDLQAQLKKTA
jgi:hypothetical protein